MLKRIEGKLTEGFFIASVMPSIIIDVVPKKIKEGAQIIRKRVKQLATNIKEGITQKNLPYDKVSLLKTDYQIGKVQVMKSIGIICIFEEKIGLHYLKEIYQITEEGLKKLNVDFKNEYRDLVELPFNRIAGIRLSNDSYAIDIFKMNIEEATINIKQTIEMESFGRATAISDGRIIYSAQNYWIFYDCCIYYDEALACKNPSINKDEDIVAQLNLPKDFDIAKVEVKYEKGKRRTPPGGQIVREIADLYDQNMIAILFDGTNKVEIYDKTDFSSVNSIEFNNDSFGLDSDKKIILLSLKYLGKGIIALTGRQGIIVLLNAKIPKELSFDFVVSNPERNVEKIVIFEDGKILTVEEIGNESYSLEWSFNEQGDFEAQGILKNSTEGNLCCFQTFNKEVIFSKSKSKELFKWTPSK